jgi:hypothetical protein
MHFFLAMCGMSCYSHESCGRGGGVSSRVRAETLQSGMCTYIQVGLFSIAITGVSRVKNISLPRGTDTNRCHVSVGTGKRGREKRRKRKEKRKMNSLRQNTYRSCYNAMSLDGKTVISGGGWER